MARPSPVQAIACHRNALRRWGFSLARAARRRRRRFLSGSL